MLCAIYCRLSKEDEGKHQVSESIQNQKTLLLQYAVEQGWEVFEIYVDDDFSGVDSLRPAFNKMLLEAQNGSFDIILCKSQSRFTRDMELVEKYIHGKFIEWEIRFVAVADNVDTQLKGNKKARQINGLINEWYLEDLSENVRMVLDLKRREGKYIGGYPIYGYKKCAENKNKLVIDEPAAKVVRQIFMWAADGYGKQKITALLNEQGIISPSKYKEIHGWGSCKGELNKDDGFWNKTSVWRILTNEMYIGTMVQGRHKKLSYKSKKMVSVPSDSWFKIPNTHEAIVDAALFDEVKEKRKVRTKQSKNGEIHLFAGLVRCMDCGGTMTKTSSGKEPTKRYYLRCMKSSLGISSSCTRHNIRLDCLTELVLKKLHKHIRDVFGQEDFLRVSRELNTKSREEFLAHELALIENKLEMRLKALKGIYLDLAAGYIDTNQFIRISKEFSDENKVLNEKKTTICSELKSIAVPKEISGADFNFVIEKIINACFSSRELIELAIEKIEVGEKNNNFQEIKINWNF